jgi:hypothetical protein
VVTYFSLIDQRNSLQTSIEAVKTGIASGDLTAMQQRLDDLNKQAKKLEALAEEVLETEVRQAMANEGIDNPFSNVLKTTIIFPPVQASLEEPPKLLVISPRNKIERTQSFTIDPNTSPSDIEAMEKDITNLGYSALVVDLGGIATYPSFVTNNYGVHAAVDTTVHEWMHQYLFFRPLGFRYGLQQVGVNESADIMIMNETLADMVGQEVGDMLYAKYYKQYEQPSSAAPATASGPGFDFNAAMRQIRTTVDEMLAQGKVDEAEAFMEQSRQNLAQHGYYIRKLNQAYFAFYGSYASSPAFSNPIGEGLAQLRSQSITLAGFVNTISSMTGRADLDKAVKASPQASG